MSLTCPATTTKRNSEARHGQTKSPPRDIAAGFRSLFIRRASLAELSAEGLLHAGDEVAVLADRAHDLARGFLRDRRALGHVDLREGEEIFGLLRLGARLRLIGLLLALRKLLHIAENIGRDRVGRDADEERALRRRSDRVNRLCRIQSRLVIFARL